MTFVNSQYILGGITKEDIMNHLFKNKTRRALVLFAMCATVAPASLAEFIAYEGFDHEPYVSNGSLGGLSGGRDYPDYGWAAGWAHTYNSSKNDTLGAVSSNSLTYAGVNSHGHKLKFARDLTRRLKTTVGGTDGTIWIGFLSAHINANITTSYHLRSGDDIVLSITHAGKNTVKLHGVDTGLNTIAGTRLNLLRIDFAPEGNTAYLWLNPDLSSEPDISTANATKAYNTNWTFNIFRVDTGTGSNYSMLDELRIGTTFRDSIIPTMPSGGTRFILR